MGKEPLSARRRFQFELRQLFLLTAIVAMGLWARAAADLVLFIACFAILVALWTWLTVSVAHAVANIMTRRSRPGR
jgi:ABC-type proline/glycine betaine transport system permease subunit